MKNIFRLIAIVGLILICMLVFNVLTDPWQVVPSVIVYGCDKPLWLNVVFVLGFFYIMSLCGIYDIISNKKNS